MGDGWEWGRSRPTCCVLGYLRWEGYGGHFGELEAVELDEGVKGALVPQPVKQVISILINIQECFTITCLTILFHSMFSFLHWSFYTFQSPKDPPPNAGAQHTKL